MDTGHDDDPDDRPGAGAALRESMKRARERARRFIDDERTREQARRAADVTVEVGRKVAQTTGRVAGAAATTVRENVLGVDCLAAVEKALDDALDVIAAQRAQIAALETRVAELERREGADSRTGGTR